jgi:hypothetical protein
VQLSQPSFTIAEGTLTANISVTLNVATTSSVSVAYETQNGTATAGQDFAMSTGVLVFDPGQTVQTFTIPILPDELDEPDETILLALSSPVNATLGEPASGTLTIVDDDPTPSLSFSLGSMTVDENDGFANVIVRLSAASGRTVTVDYTTIGETAVAGSDFSTMAGTLTFSPGETSKTVAVPILDDNVDEPNETFLVLISSPVNALLAIPDNMRITIVDADLPVYTRFFAAIFANSAIGEPNDGCVAAYRIQPNITYQFLPDDVHDWYQFDLTEDGDLVAELTNFLPLRGQIALFKGDDCATMTHLKNNGDTAETKIVDVGPQTAGHYFVYVSNDGTPNNDKPYRLRIRFE